MGFLTPTTDKLKYRCQNHCLWIIYGIRRIVRVLSVDFLSYYLQSLMVIAGNFLARQSCEYGQRKNIKSRCPSPETKWHVARTDSRQTSFKGVLNKDRLKIHNTYKFQ